MTFSSAPESARNAAARRQAAARASGPAADPSSAPTLDAFAHDVRNPLMSILGYAEMLSNGDAGFVNAQQQAMLSIIERSAKHLIAMTDELLSQEHTEPSDGPVDLRTLIRDINQTLIPMSRPRGVTVAVDVDEDIAAIPGDVLAIDRVFMNVIGNAIKFTPRGGSITVKAERVDHAVKISVIDTGIGIAPEDQHRVFEPFFRSSSANTDKIHGTGLGLSIARKIVEKHQGGMNLKSTVGKGTTVSILLPLAKADILTSA